MKSSQKKTFPSLVVLLGTKWGTGFVGLLSGVLAANEEVRYNDQPNLDEGATTMFVEQEPDNNNMMGDAVEGLLGVDSDPPTPLVSPKALRSSGNLLEAFLQNDGADQEEELEGEQDFNPHTATTFARPSSSLSGSKCRDAAGSIQRDSKQEDPCPSSTDHAFTNLDDGHLPASTALVFDMHGQPRVERPLKPRQDVSAPMPAVHPSIYHILPDGEPDLLREKIV
ncbi:unnamed protein product, partial [Amoebophrya sp. A25]|eukprot:GSA25T00021102001.1